jgi:hypothetical protein
MRNRLIFAFLVVVFARSTGIAETNTVFNFLRIDMTPRAAGLAGSAVTMNDDPSALFYNPAAVGTLTTTRGGVGFFKNLLDVNAGAFSYGEQFDFGTLAAGVVYQHYGTFTQTDEVGNSIGSFTASDMALMVAYSNTLDKNLYWGATAKFIHSSIADAGSSALAADLGLLYTIPESRLAFGVSVRNLGGQLSTFAGVKEDLPLDVTVGASVVPRGLPLLLSVNLHKLNQEGTVSERLRSFTIGGEFTLSRIIQLRIGFDNEQRKDLTLANTSGLTGFSGGLGITIDRYRVDYAISSLGSIGTLHRVGITSTF